MITLNKRKIPLTWEEMKVGFENDNAVEERQFLITDEALFDFTFKLDIKAGERTDIVALDKVLSEDGVVLTWKIFRGELCEGRNLCQIRAYNEGSEVWHSEIAEFLVGKSINAVNTFPSPLPTEFEQFERRIEEAVTRAEEAAQNVEVPPASETVRGAVRIGQGLQMDGDVLSVTGEAVAIIPPASADTIGGIKVGNHLSVDADGVLSVDLESYSGNYEVTPGTGERNLDTANKLMTDDLKISAIPFHEVSNDSGGTTVTIG